MTHARHPLDKTVRKKEHKEVKRGQKLLSVKEPATEDNKLTPEELLNRQPKKFLKKEKGILAAIKKTLGIKKKKLHSSHSKRTTPGEVIGQPGAPANAHKEGKRWNKTVNLQNKVKSDALAAKMAKKR